ncbi:MAG TPA: hypothetical protein VHC97_01040 [Thermoanaerobaculia bacterium]|jgi:hypothetical protein|nr:hypothetical protein [Thermoanaerobaculia bacterium]
MKPFLKSPWLWIGLSFGVLVVGVGGCLVASVMTLKSARELRGRIRSEPVLLNAEMIALKDPNVKVVSRDPKHHTVALRNLKTDERFFLAQTDEGKLLIQTKMDSVVPDVAGTGKPWSVTDTSLRLGSAAGAPPSWVPAPAGTRAHSIYALDTNGVVSGCAVLAPSGPVEDVFAFYRGHFERKGFSLVPAQGSVSATSPDWRSSFFASPTSQGDVMLVWSEMSGNP